MSWANASISLEVTNQNRIGFENVVDKYIKSSYFRIIRYPVDVEIHYKRSSVGCVVSIEIIHKKIVYYFWILRKNTLIQEHASTSSLIICRICIQGELPDSGKGSCRTSVVAFMGVMIGQNGRAPEASGVGGRESWGPNLVVNDFPKFFTASLQKGPHSATSSPGYVSKYKQNFLHSYNFFDPLFSSSLWPELLGLAFTKTKKLTFKTLTS
ncbi:hypothetical protein TNIN_311191 [Trichonephila inaurata madagascariensis]|uniref:Uncharacterized protein n=1 Tax=Trichonephila inaurata madagascariensis TaxID=2747483 RepID=A0A8X6WRA6_9ARAC|nr:hypothetical protein TNIN_311191 [Trichonephila inaurata madagascariensis]